eukprot:scaffold33488_cov52-Phaeocystis_antarctica.AAC.1
MARLKAGTHLEHVLHVRDIGRVEAERLVERRRDLPSQNAGACDVWEAVRSARHEGVGGGGDASGVHGEGPTQGCGGQGTRGAHGEHVAHGHDLGRVEAERLVERPR